MGTDHGAAYMTRRRLKLLVSCFVFVFDEVVKDIAQFFGYKLPARCIVLYYHTVLPNQKEAFRHQMQILLRRTASVSGRPCPAPQSGV